MQDPCNDLCRGKQRMERIIEVCILCLLAEEDSHGYRLIEQLGPFGFDENNLNIGSLYRTLRRMESQQLIRSQWAPSGQGPRKRIYQITDPGRLELGAWITLLRKRRNRISLLIERFEHLPDQKEG